MEFSASLDPTPSVLWLSSEHGENYVRWTHHPSFSGDLATLQQAAGLTQTELAQATSLTCFISQWKQEAVVDMGQPTPERLLRVLTPPGGGHFRDAMARSLLARTEAAGVMS